MRELCGSMGCMMTGQPLNNDMISALISGILYLLIILFLANFYGIKYYVGSLLL